MLCHEGSVLETRFSVNLPAKCSWINGLSAWGQQTNISILLSSSESVKGLNIKCIYFLVNQAYVVLSLKKSFKRENPPQNRLYMVLYILWGSKASIWKQRQLTGLEIRALWLKRWLHWFSMMCWIVGLPYGQLQSREHWYMFPRFCDLPNFVSC